MCHVTSPTSTTAWCYTRGSVMPLPGHPLAHYCGRRTRKMATLLCESSGRRLAEPLHHLRHCLWHLVPCNEISPRLHAACSTPRGIKCMKNWGAPRAGPRRVPTFQCLLLWPVLCGLALCRASMLFFLSVLGECLFLWADLSLLFSHAITHHDLCQA
jgi:hypothetical protein